MKNHMLHCLFFLFTVVVACTATEEGAPVVAGDEDETDQEIVAGDQSLPTEEGKADDPLELFDEVAEETGADAAEEAPDFDESAITFDPPDEPEDPVAYIVTVEMLRYEFEKMAVLHTLLGVPTAVTTIESICGSFCDDDDPRNDTAAAIKAWAMGRPGIRYLILGGDIELVPSRPVHDRYSNLVAGTFEEDFKSDHYFADFSEWDGNHDGIYAQEGIDAPDLLPEIAVSRIPVSDTDEATRYFEKVRRYLTAYPAADARKAILLANIATTYNGIAIHAGYYFEAEGRTASLIPPEFAVRRLYTPTIPMPSLQAEVLTLEKERQALEAGVNLVVHNGHGFPNLLTCEQADDSLNFTGEMAYNLFNQTPLIFLSCACQAGQFEAPFTWHYTDSEGNPKERVFIEDAAGERLINAPHGGAILYLGNTTTGLGLAGGSQLIDEVVRYFFMQERPIVGDALVAARLVLKKSDTFTPPVVNMPLPVVDPESWAWTQKAVVLLGDALLPFWRAELPPSAVPSFTVERVNGGVRMVLSQIPQGATARLHFCGNYYTVPASAAELTVVAPGDCLTAEAALSAPTTQCWYESVPTVP